VPVLQRSGVRIPSATRKSARTTLGSRHPQSLGLRQTCPSWLALSGSTIWLCSAHLVFFRRLGDRRRRSARRRSQENAPRRRAPPGSRREPPWLPALTIPRLFSALARKPSAGTTGFGRRNAEMTLRRRILGSRLGGWTVQRDREPFGFAISVRQAPLAPTPTIGQATPLEGP
jgi:hypothetical protein